ncbi:rhodanese-like domain-containing protein [Pseudalkalibacillus berkeleyi]|uniref:Rhodanese-like domain-containing protein n=1 Tax=Pseudalkalibacillus berkeleyi TaxID=1069813 RepID=A0ABS9H3F4_9BACL|nr:rhodanese-like domain-containing protein [Pseudalkalibacillus berkeleyi]MCF6138350.1 rhodanese-like domain-containing protein [Pseudalkalibacillus berkeleyi]
MEDYTVRTITPEEVDQLLKEGKNVSIIDVREDEEVAAGKIPEAKHIRLSEISERMEEINKDEEHIMVCRSGRRSENASLFLQEQGYKVKNMTGGMLEWEGDTK